jgi:hypothetical protein
MRKVFGLVALAAVLMMALSCAPQEDVGAMKEKVEKLEREVAFLKQKVGNQDAAIDFIRDALSEKKIEVKVPEPVVEDPMKTDPETPEEPEKTQKKLK